MAREFTPEEEAQIKGRRCFCGFWPCETHTDQDRLDYAARQSFDEDHSTGNDRSGRSIKHSYRGEGRNFVD